MQPIISIVIPAFNAAGFIGLALESAINQTERRLEILVIDDGSTDSTVEVVRSFQARDERIRLIELGVNRGHPRARNVALDASRGDWVAQLDADDRFEPHRLETLMRLGREHGAELVADNLTFRDLTTARWLGTALPEDTPASCRVITAEDFVRGNLFGHLGFHYGYLQPILRRPFLIEHGIRWLEHLRVNSDYPFCLDCLLKGARFVLTSEPMYVCNYRPDSLSRKMHLEDLEKLRALNTRLLEQCDRFPAGLAKALRMRQRSIDNAISYKQFTTVALSGHPVAAAVTFLQNPAFAPFISQRIKRDLQRIARRLVTP